jgi:hypothetical protein
VSSDPTTDDLHGEKDIFPPILLILGAVFEVFFGAVGLLNGLGVLCFGLASPSATIATMTSQLLLGWFTFCVYVFAAPAFNEKHDQSPPVYPAGTFNDYQQRVAVAWGYIISSVTYCFCMQGFGFFVALQLYFTQVGKRETNPAKNVPRLISYSLVILFGGIGMLVLGGMARKQSGVHLISDVYVYPPNIIKYANITITAGVFLVTYALFGVVCAFKKGLSRVFLCYAVVVWTYLITAHVMAQLGLAGTGFAFAAPSIGVLTTSVVFAPAYFAYNIDMEPEPTNV